MRVSLGLVFCVLSGPAMASPLGEQLPELLYAGQATAQRDGFADACDSGHADACFGVGLIDVILAAEGLSQALYRHGATTPDMRAAALFLGTRDEVSAGPANPNPEPLSYEGLRAIFDDFVTGLDQAQQGFLLAAEAGEEFSIVIDPLRVRLDINGDGQASDGETLATLLDDILDLPQGKTKGDKTASVDTTIGFDRADAYWFAGYTQVTAAPFDFVLAHDFSKFFGAIGHRIFPKAGLPMQDYTRGGTLMMDPDTDTFLSDAIAALHTAQFPVADPERLKGVLERLQSVTALSRQNWEAILSETDDNRELVPSPSQTSIMPGHDVTEEVVAAWMATLDSIDAILSGQLLVPHWRFSQGFDLKVYFETATETDLVMLLTGQGALPFLRDGPIADADSFAEGNAVFGDSWPNFAIWFN